MINYFGGSLNIIIIALFVCSFFLLCSLITNKIGRFVFALFASAFTTLQLASLFFTQSFIGYQFYSHLNLRGVIGISGLFIPHIIASIFLFFFLVSLLHHSRKLIYNVILPMLKCNIKPLIINIAIFLLIGLFLSVITLKGSFITDSKSLVSILNTNTDAFVKVLHKHGLDDYVTPEDIKCKAGKNIIVVSIESLEKGYMSSKYSSLTPNLRNLKNNWAYYDLEQNSGSDWTSGSLYTYLTGFPAYFGVDGNSIFQKAYHSEISGVSHVLEKANYRTIYICGDTEHAGVKEMLNIFKFDRIIDYKNVEKNGFESNYGLRDKDVFDLAKKEIEKRSRSQEPFALFISTTDTHFPNGIYDERMETAITPKNSDLEFMVAAVDYMIGNFIEFLQTQKMMENTVVYLFPDHLKMGSPSMFENTGKRGLYLITNADNSRTSMDTRDTMYQIDLPKIILSGAAIEHNLKFLTDYLNGDKDNFIKNNIREITEINTNGILRLGSQPSSEKRIAPN